MPEASASKSETIQDANERDDELAVDEDKELHNHEWEIERQDGDDEEGELDNWHEKPAEFVMKGVFRFMDLPLELRISIYEYAIPDGEDLGSNDCL